MSFPLCVFLFVLSLTTLFRVNLNLPQKGLNFNFIPKVNETFRYNLKRKNEHIKIKKKTLKNIFFDKKNMIKIIILMGAIYQSFDRMTNKKLLKIFI